MDEPITLSAYVAVILTIVALFATGCKKARNRGGIGVAPLQSLPQEPGTGQRAGTDTEEQVSWLPGFAGLDSQGTKGVREAAAAAPVSGPSQDLARNVNNLLFLISGNISLARLQLSENARALGRLTDAEEASGQVRDLVRQLFGLPPTQEEGETRIAKRETEATDRGSRNGDRETGERATALEEEGEEKAQEDRETRIADRETETGEERKKRVLVMDESSSVGDVIGAMVTCLGYGVTCAQDSSAAVELYRNAVASEEPFDVVILDVAMTDGVGLEEVLKAMREANPLVKIIASAPYADDPVLLNFESHGFAAAIAKPYNMEELGELLSRLMA